MKENFFQDIFRGKTVIVGIGNALRGDDGFGPALIKRLKRQIPAVCIDAGSAPENYAGKIAKEDPETILIVDAIHLGLAPGEYLILRKEDVLKGGLSTHDISMHMLIDYLEKQTRARIFILGVQPKDVSFGAEMAEELKKALKEITQCMSLI
jgi:hydrogenase 3 maturation protease